MDNEVKFEEDYGYNPQKSSDQVSGGLAGFTAKVSGGILNSSKKIIYFWVFVSLIFFSIAYSIVRNTVNGASLVDENVLKELSPPEYYLLNKNVK